MDFSPTSFFVVFLGIIIGFATLLFYFFANLFKEINSIGVEPDEVSEPNREGIPGPEGVPGPTITLTKNEVPRKDNLPELVSKLCYTSNAWIIGGAARETEPRDYDVMVPHSHWHIAAQLIPRDARPNAFGGWKCVSEGKSVDIWPDDLANLMTAAPCRDLWHPRSGSRFKRTQ